MPDSMGGPGGAMAFNGNNYAPANFPGGTGFQFGGGRENAIGSSGVGGPTGFYQQPPGAFHSFINSIGSGAGNLAGGGLRGIAMLLGHLLGGGSPSMPQPGGGITPSAGGWAIDKNGNLVSSSPSTSSPGTQTRSGPSPISHTTSMPGWAASSMAENMRRNQI